MRLSRSLHQFRAQICHKPWRAKSLRLAAAYTSYGAADKILRRLMKSTAAYGGGYPPVLHQLLRMTDTWTECLEQGGQVDSIYTDFEKALVAIWWGLWCNHQPILIGN